MNNNFPEMPNIALIAASGVSETEMTAIQRALAAKKWRAHVISPESGLIHSWAEGAWGHCYPADGKIEVSLGSDFDMLILPSGQRHVDKLMQNAHTKRIIGAMAAMKKPIVAFADGQRMLVENDLMGENATVMVYVTPEELTAAATEMIAIFETAFIAAQDAEDEQQAA